MKKHKRTFADRVADLLEKNPGLSYYDVRLAEKFLELQLQVKLGGRLSVDSTPNDAKKALRGEFKK